MSRVAKLLAEALPIALIAFLRCALAWRCSGRWRAGWTGRCACRRDVMRNLALQALFGTAIYNAGLLAGLRLTTALEGGLVLATLPAVVALGGAVLAARAPAARGNGLAVALAAGGMAAITWRARWAGGAGRRWATCWCSAACWGRPPMCCWPGASPGAVPVITASLWMQGFSRAGAAALRAARLRRGGGAGRSAAGGAAGVPSPDGERAVPAAVVRRAEARAGRDGGVFTAFLPAPRRWWRWRCWGRRSRLAHAAGFVLMMGSVAAGDLAAAGGGK